MNKVSEYIDSFTLIGLTTRTSNAAERNPATAKIGGMMQHYWGKQVAKAFNGRRQPGVTFAAYTDYESDEHGNYTYFIGEVVETLCLQDLSQFQTLTLPASHYLKFTPDRATMPAVVIQAWQAIWQMTPTDLQGTRTYQTDFEIYDERAEDPQAATLDIYLGIAPS